MDYNVWHDGEDANRLTEQLTFALKDYMAQACVRNKRLRDTLLALCLHLASP